MALQSPIKEWGDSVLVPSQLQKMAHGERTWSVFDGRRRRMVVRGVLVVIEVSRCFSVLGGGRGG